MDNLRHTTDRVLCYRPNNHYEYQWWSWSAKFDFVELESTWMGNCQWYAATRANSAIHPYVVDKWEVGEMWSTVHEYECSLLAHN